MSSAEDLRAIRLFFDRVVPTTEQGRQIKLEFAKWYNSPSITDRLASLEQMVTHGDSSYHYLQDARKFRDAYNNAERGNVDVSGEVLNHIFNHVAGRFG